MKRLVYFMFFVLMVILILSFLTDISSAKDNLGRWLNRMPGRPPRAYLSKEVYLHSSNEYPGVNVSSPIVKLCPVQNTWIDLPAKSSFSVRTVLITTATLDGASSTYAVAWATQPDVPRCLGVAFDESFTTNSYHCNVTLAGIDARGNSISEVVISSINTIAYTNNAYAGQVAVTVGEIEYSTGVMSTDLVANKLRESGVRLNIATGDKIGATGEIRDFFYTSEDYVQQSTATYTVNHVYNTILPTNVPNAALDYRWIYTIDSESNPR